MDDTNNKEYLKWIMPSISNRSVPEKLYKDDFNFRVEKAKEQYDLFMNKYKNNISKPEWIPSYINEIRKYVDEFLFEIIGLTKPDPYNPVIQPKNTASRKIPYATINKENKYDIVWIKFTNIGCISVIGTGCDIYFTDLTKKNTTAGRINHILSKIYKTDIQWYEDKVLIFPLIGIPKGLNRADIESGIGNYLISKGVPILDFYSHNF